MTAAAAAPKKKSALTDDLNALFQSPRELWIIYFAKFLEMLGVFSLLYIVTLWLSSDLGYSDVTAGSIVGFYSLALSIVTFLIGFFADSWGFRETLIGAFAISMIARGTMAFASSRWLGVGSLMLLTLGTAGGAPVMNTAIRRYTKEQTRAFAFSLYYVTFNVSAAVAGVLIDVAKAILPNPKVMHLPLMGDLSMSQYRLTFVVGGAAAMISFVLSLFLRKGVDLERHPDKYPAGTGVASAFLWFMFMIAGLVVVQMSSTLLEATSWKFELTKSVLLKSAAVCAVLATAGVVAIHLSGLFRPHRTTADAPIAEGAPYRKSAAEEKPDEAEDKGASKNPFKTAFSVLKERTFWRFMLFVGLLVFVKLIFSHSHFTFPKYAIREMGKSFPLGAFQAINPILIIILVPVATALTRKRSAFNVIVLGSIVSALSPFILVLGPSYATIIGEIVLLSIGECLWSPRLYEYTASIAPRGKEASYMGMSSLPMFFAKMVVGPMSGWLLATYCPAEGPRRSWVMWLIIGITTLVGPFLIIFLRGVIEGGKKSDPVPPAAAPAPGE
jgi:dipeptide/tripeptide permease